MKSPMIASRFGDLLACLGCVLVAQLLPLGISPANALEPVTQDTRGCHLSLQPVTAGVYSCPTGRSDTHLICTGYLSPDASISRLEFVGHGPTFDLNRIQRTRDGFSLGYDLESVAHVGVNQLILELSDKHDETLFFEFVVDPVPPTVRASNDLSTLEITDSLSEIAAVNLIMRRGDGSYITVGKTAADSRLIVQSPRQYKLLLSALERRDSLLVVYDQAGNRSDHRPDGGDVATFLERFNAFQQAERRKAARAIEAATDLRAAGAREYSLPLAVVYNYSPGATPQDIGQELRKISNHITDNLTILDQEFTLNQSSVPGFLESTLQSLVFFIREINTNVLQRVSFTTTSLPTTFTVDAVLPLPPASATNPFETSGEGGASIRVGGLGRNRQYPYNLDLQKAIYDSIPSTGAWESQNRERARVVVFYASIDEESLCGFFPYADPPVPYVFMAPFRGACAGTVLNHELAHSFGMDHVFTPFYSASFGLFPGEAPRNFLYPYASPELSNLTVAQAKLLQYRIWGTPSLATASPGVENEFAGASYGTEMYAKREFSGTGQRLHPPIIEAPFERRSFPFQIGRLATQSDRFPSPLSTESRGWSSLASDYSNVNYNSFDEAQWKSFPSGKINPETGVLDVRAGVIYLDQFKILDHSRPLRIALQSLDQGIFSSRSKYETAFHGMGEFADLLWTELTGFEATWIEVPVTSAHHRWLDVLTQFRGLDAEIRIFINDNLVGHRLIKFVSRSEWPAAMALGIDTTQLEPRGPSPGGLFLPPED